MTDRPTDKDTAEVVAWRKGWNDAYYFPDRLGGQTHCFRPKDDYDAEYVLDPRSDTDAALELLHYLIDYWNERHHSVLKIDRCGEGWTITPWSCGTDTFGGDIRPGRLIKLLPISGEPFRNAVVRLAVEVKKAQNKETT